MSSMHEPVGDEKTKRKTRQFEQRMAGIQHKLLVLSGKGGIVDRLLSREQAADQNHATRMVST